MRLSEAIMLGSTIIRPTPGGGPSPHSNSGTGCVLQMALMAIGETERAYMFQGPDLELCWLIWGHSLASRAMNSFDSGIHCKSMDEFVDWVRSIEPAEPEEESDGPDPHDMEVETEMERERRA